MKNSILKILLLLLLLIQFVSHVKNQNLVAVSVKTLLVKYLFKQESRLNTYLDISFLIAKINEKSVKNQVSPIDYIAHKIIRSFYLGKCLLVVF